MTTLSSASLATLPAAVSRPGYDRSAVRRGVVHFGPGAFHRAHQAAAFDTLLGHDPRWGITGVSLNSRSVAEALNPQDGLYTLALLDEHTEYRVMGSIGQVLTRGDPDAILAALASADTRIISSTVTEKGYCLGRDGALDFAHPVIRADLEASRDTNWRPGSLVGWLVRGLQARRAAGLPGVTVLSCDNLAENGRKLREATISLAEALDAQTAGWIADYVVFPNTMVDSITPATNGALRAGVRQATGLEDAWPIQRERFTQWVIEDQFAGERPDLSLAGVTFAKDVRPFEAAKLRLLNGAHSSLAYLGLARGWQTVADAMRDCELATFVERLMREDVAVHLTAPIGMDLSSYIDDILARFANPAISHQLSQIAWDGSQKLPYRLLDTIREALGTGRSIQRLAVPIAGWLNFLRRAALEGRALTDPLADALLDRAADWRAVLQMTEIFGGLGQDARFRDAVEHALATLEAGQLESL